MPPLLSYGTLQPQQVELSTFGRLLKADRDVLVQFEPSAIEIEDPQVIASTGSTQHANVTFTGREDTPMTGTVFERAAGTSANVSTCREKRHASPKFFRNSCRTSGCSFDVFIDLDL